MVVGKRANPRAASAYVALWLDKATFEPLWARSYDDAGVARSIRVLTFKWNAQYRRHVTLGQSTVDLDASGVPVGGSVLRQSIVAFCTIQMRPWRPQGVAHSWTRRCPAGVTPLQGVSDKKRQNSERRLALNFCLCCQGEERM